MDIYGLLDPRLIQMGELGLAFIVVVLSAGLVTFVIKTSSQREKEYLRIITNVLPVMESLSQGIINLNLRLEGIEDSIEHRAFNNRGKKDGPKEEPKEVVDAAKVD